MSLQPWAIRVFVLLRGVLNVSGHCSPGFIAVLQILNA
jgi:hypothetical protein